MMTTSDYVDKPYDPLATFRVASIPRQVAERIARKAGGIVQPKVNHQTNVIVLGKASPIRKAEVKGQKLLDADFEGEVGRKIAIIREKRFLRLAGK